MKAIVPSLFAATAAAIVSNVGAVATKAAPLATPSVLTGILDQEPWIISIPIKSRSSQDVADRIATTKSMATQNGVAITEVYTSPSHIYLVVKPKAGMAISLLNGFRTLVQGVTPEALLQPASTAFQGFVGNLDSLKKFEVADAIPNDVMHGWNRKVTGYTPSLDAPHAPDRILVRYLDASIRGNASDKAAAISRVSAITGKYRASSFLMHDSDANGRMELVTVPLDADLATVLADYNASPDVAYAQPDYRIAHTMSGPSVSGLSYWSQESTTMADINEYNTSTSSWVEPTTGSPGLVCDIDTGLNTTHQDLSGNYADNVYSTSTYGYNTLNTSNYDGSGYSTYSLGSQSNPTDDVGHGTMTAGLIAADANVGFAGMAYNAPIASLKALDSAGYGFTSSLHLAYQLAMGNSVNLPLSSSPSTSYSLGSVPKVINLSLGGSFDLTLDGNPNLSSLNSTTGSTSGDLYQIAGAGIAVSAAAGNNYWNLDNSSNYNPTTSTPAGAYPACDFFPNMVSVSSIDPSTDYAGEAVFNGDVVNPNGIYTDYGAFGVDLAAPGGSWSSFSPTSNLASGSNITYLDGSGYGGYPTFSPGIGGNNYYTYAVGTSFAAPIVAGAIDLLRAQFPNETATEIMDRLRFSASALSTSPANQSWSGGKLNMSAAMDPRPVLRSMSTQINVQTGSNIAVVGFIVTGHGSVNKCIEIGARGQSIGSSYLQNPTITVYNSSGTALASGTGWTNSPSNYSSYTVYAVSSSYASTYGLSSSYTQDSALILDLPPGSYTAEISGVSGATGYCYCDVNDADVMGNGLNSNPTTTSGTARLSNFSARGYVQTGTAGTPSSPSNAMTASIVAVGSYNRSVLITGLGPSLGSFGLSGVSNPTLTALGYTNETDWQTWASWPIVTRIINGLYYAPGSTSEPAVDGPLSPSTTYTAVLAAASGTSAGTGVLSVYEF